MRKVFEFALICPIVITSSQYSTAQAKDLAATDRSKPTGDLSALPPLPQGESTILGGAIRDVDPVLDRFTLRIVGAKPMKITFDERTQLFLDGKRISLRDLRPSEHASVQTTLDGTSVFAISVHILSQLQSGDFRGQVLSYDPTTGDLNLVRGEGGEPINLRVTSGTKFSRKGQGTFASAQSGPADLQKGALVSVQFSPDGKGRGSATEIAFLATPGSQFIFSGNLTALDMHAGKMTLLDTRTNQSYEIEFNPSSAGPIQRVHAGQRVRVAADYDGTRYVAREVSVY